jgi:MurNAc alpha-1-phosphate uridylyltransferase
MVRHHQAFNYDGMGDFHLDPLGRVSRRKPGRVAPYIYTGIQLVSHRLLRDAPEGPFSTNLLWTRAMQEDRLFGLVHTGDWFEVGTPQAIPPTEERLTRA